MISSCLRSAIALAMVLTFVTGAGVASAQSTDAADAADAYRAGDYPRAAELFERAYRESPTPTLLYRWAQSLRMDGQCARALELYDRLLADTQLSPVRRDAVAASRNRPCTPKPARPSDDQDHQDDHDGEAEAGPASASTHEPAPLVTTGLEPATTDTAPAPWYRDNLGHSLLAAGLVSAAAGGYFFHRSADTRAHAADQPSLDRLEDMFGRAQRDRAIAIGAVAAGGVLIIGAVVRYATDDDAPSERRLAFGASATPGGAAAVVSGRF